MTRLTAEDLAAVRPAGAGNWSPNGNQIAYFWADWSGAIHLWVATLDKVDAWHLTAPQVVLEPTDGTDRRDVMGGPQWSPTGEQLPVATSRTPGSADSERMISFHIAPGASVGMRAAFSVTRAVSK